jgi:uncharacterized protein (DUF1501 family)
LGTSLPYSARAASGDYKALVCVMLNGGMDAHDAIIPTDSAGFSKWEGFRRSLYGSEMGAVRSRSSVLPLSGSGQNFGFVPELAPLSSLYQDSKLAVLANVGPLEEATRRQNIIDRTARLPFKLGSHNDQMSMWTSMEPEGAVTGWGGRLLDEIGQGSNLAGVTFFSQSPMVAGETYPGVSINSRKLSIHDALVNEYHFGSSGVATLLEEHLRTASQSSQNLLMREVGAVQRRSLDAAFTLNRALDSTSGGDAAKISGNSLSNQLATVANLIDARSVIGLDRQIFYVQMGGFDTHANHAASFPGLLTKLAEALYSFQGVLEDLGVADKVTTFTMSDFGRTLLANSNGTDHGWGGHHFVMGGAVRGGRVVGEIPPYDLDHDQDWQRGAMIPTISVEQFGADLGRWFGLSDRQLGSVFPNLPRFGMMSESLF